MKEIVLSLLGSFLLCSFCLCARWQEVPCDFEIEKVSAYENQLWAMAHKKQEEDPHDFLIIFDYAKQNWRKIATFDYPVDNLFALADGTALILFSKEVNYRQREFDYDIIKYNQDGKSITYNIKTPGYIDKECSSCSSDGALFLFTSPTETKESEAAYDFALKAMEQSALEQAKKDKKVVDMINKIKKGVADSKIDKIVLEIANFLVTDFNNHSEESIRKSDALMNRIKKIDQKSQDLCRAFRRVFKDTYSNNVDISALQNKREDVFYVYKFFDGTLKQIDKYIGQQIAIFDFVAAYKQNELWLSKFTFKGEGFIQKWDGSSFKLFSDDKQFKRPKVGVGSDGSVYCFDNQTIDNKYNADYVFKLDNGVWKKLNIIIKGMGTFFVNKTDDIWFFNTDWTDHYKQFVFNWDGKKLNKIEGPAFDRLLYAQHDVVFAQSKDEKYYLWIDDKKKSAPDSQKIEQLKPVVKKVIAPAPKK